MFKAASDLVMVYATVRDGRGALVRGLTKDDFEVRENGSVREIAAFSNDIQPITLAMLLDRSGSLAQRAPAVTAAALGFFDALLPGDRISMGSLSWDCVPLTGNLTSLREGVTGPMPMDMGSPIWDSLDRAFFSMADEAGRRAILIFSDGMDTGWVGWSPRVATLGGPCRAARAASGSAMREIAARAERNGVLIYAVGVPTALGRRDGDLRTVARNTGGEYFEMREDESLTPVFQRIAEELHHQYAFGFVPTQRDGRAARIEVRMKPRGLNVRARRSFSIVPDDDRPGTETAILPLPPLTAVEVETAIKDGLAGRTLRASCLTPVTAIGAYFEVQLEGPIARIRRAARDARQRREAFTLAEVTDRLKAQTVHVSAVGRVNPPADPHPGSVLAGELPPRPAPTAAPPFASTIRVRGLGERPRLLDPVTTASLSLRQGPSETRFDLAAFRNLGSPVEIIVGSPLAGGEARCQVTTRTLAQVR